MGGCVYAICKYYAIISKGLEHPKILVSTGVKAVPCEYQGTTEIPWYEGINLFQEERQILLGYSRQINDFSVHILISETHEYIAKRH